MRIKNKLIIGLSIATVLIAISTKSSAVEFRSRVLSKQNLNLGSTVIAESDGTVSLESANLNETEFGAYSSGAVQLSLETALQNPSIFCMEPDVMLPSNQDIPYINYSATSNTATVVENNRLAYLLSYPRAGVSSGATFGAKPLNGALWRAFPGVTAPANAAGADLYNEAVAFEAWRQSYSNPVGDDTNAVAVGSNIAGPFKITYNMAYSGTTMFGQITGATLTKQDGTVIDNSKWWLTSDSARK